MGELSFGGIVELAMKATAGAATYALAALALDIADVRAVATRFLKGRQARHAA